MSLPYTKKIKDMLEKGIEESGKRHGNDLGFISRKFTSPARRSVPDQIFMIDGVAFFIEYKRWGQRPTPNQLDEHEKLRAAGMRVYVVDNVVDGRALLDEVIDIVRIGRVLGADTSTCDLPERIYWTGYADKIHPDANVHRC